MNKLKGIGVRSWRMLLSILLFLAAIFLLPALFSGISNPLILFALLFLLFQAAAAGIDMLQGRVPPGFVHFFKVFARYLFGTFLEILLVLLILPAIALEMILGPLMFLVFILSLVLLVIFLIEDILGHDIKGVVSLDNGIQALYVLAALAGSGFVIYKNQKVQRFIESWSDKAADLVIYLETGRKQKTQNPGGKTW